MESTELIVILIHETKGMECCSMLEWAAAHGENPRHKEQL
jgi:hypothetical protein